MLCLLSCFIQIFDQGVQQITPIRITGGKTESVVNYNATNNLDTGAAPVQKILPQNGLKSKARSIQTQTDQLLM